MNTLNRAMTLICTAVVLSTLPVQAGLVMKSTTKSDSREKSAEMQNMTTAISVEGKCMRMEFLESKNPVMNKGDYMLSTDGGQTFNIVHPKEKTYAKFDLAALSGVMSMMSMKYSNTKIETLADDAGPEILGYPTKYTKNRLSYTMEMSIMGFKSKTSSVDEMETWATTKINATALENWARNFVGKMGNKDMDAMIDSYRKNIKGVPLKQVTKMSTTDQNGKKTVQTITTQVTELKEQSIPAKTFEIPAGFKEVSMLGEMPAEDGEGNSGDSGSGGAPSSLGDMMKMFRK